MYCTHPPCDPFEVSESTKIEKLNANSSTSKRILFVCFLSTGNLYIFGNMTVNQLILKYRSYFHYSSTTTLFYALLYFSFSANRIRPIKAAQPMSSDERQTLITELWQTTQQSFWTSVNLLTHTHTQQNKTQTHKQRDLWGACFTTLCSHRRTLKIWVWIHKTFLRRSLFYSNIL